MPLVGAEMRLSGAFFANRVEVVDDMLNVEGGVWASTTVPARAAAFQRSCVVLCDTRRRDVGTNYTLIIPNRPAHRAQGGRHVYSFRPEGSNGRFDIPLDVVV